MSARKSRVVLLKGGENPIFARKTRQGLSVAIRIENKNALRFSKTEKGIYLSLLIPPESCIRLAYIALRVALPQVRTKGKRYEEVGVEEILSSIATASKQEPKEKKVSANEIF